MFGDRFGFLILAAAVATAVALFARLRSTRTAVDFQLASRQIGAVTNGFAIAGDYLSAASFLGVAGGVYAAGLDGAWYATGFAAGFVPVVLFIAAPLRRFGERSLPDFLARRFDNEPLRITSVLAVELITLAYLIPQAVGGGLAWQLLTDLSLPGLGSYATGVVGTMLVAGALVIVGGMRGTTWNQALQFVVLLGIFTWLAVAAARAGFSYTGALRAVNEAPLREPSPDGADRASVMVNQITGNAAFFDAPGARYSRFELAALLFTLVFGTAGLPHVMNRFFASATGRAARLSAVWVLGLVGVFYGLAIMLGTIAREVISERSAEGAGDGGWLDALTIDGVLEVADYALLAMGRLFSGDTGLSVVVTGAILAILSTIGGLLLAASSTWGSDIYERHINPRASHHQALRVGQLTVGFVAIVAALVAVSLDPTQASGPSSIADLVTGAFGVAASTFTPVLIMSVWSRRVTGESVLFAMSIGLVLSVGCVVASMVWSDAPVLVRTPAIVVVPLVVAVGAVITARTEPPGSLDDIWVRMHGTAADRQAERLAKIAVGSSQIRP